MSNYRNSAYNPKTGKIEEADWLDNHFGSHIYGVKFDGSDEVFRAFDCGLLAIGAALSRLQQSNAELVEALKAALPRIAHKVSCHAVRPAHEWAEHGSASFEGCDCERKTVLTAIANAAKSPDLNINALAHFTTDRN